MIILKRSCRQCSGFGVGSPGGKSVFEGAQVLDNGDAVVAPGSAQSFGQEGLSQRRDAARGVAVHRLLALRCADSHRHGEHFPDFLINAGE